MESYATNYNFFHLRIFSTNDHLVSSNMSRALLTLVLRFPLNINSYCNGLLLTLHFCLFLACVSPLGLTSKKLPNSALTASSEVRELFLAYAHCMRIHIHKRVKKLCKKASFFSFDTISPSLPCSYTKHQSFKYFPITT